MQQHLAFARTPLCLQQQFLTCGPIHARNEIAQVTPSGCVAFHAQQLRQAQIAVKDATFSVQHGGALLHTLHQRVVGKVCAFQCIDAMAFGFLDHECVDGAVADGVQGLFGFVHKTCGGFKSSIFVQHLSPDFDRFGSPVSSFRILFRFFSLPQLQSH